MQTGGRHVVVVGGGIVGLCTAYALRKAGARVTVLERSGVGSGASRGNAGWVVPAFAGPFPGPHVRRQLLAALVGKSAGVRIRPGLGAGMPSWLWRCWRRCTEAHRVRGVVALAGLAGRAIELYQGMAADGVAFDLHRSGVLVAFLNEGAASHYLHELRPLADLGYRLPTEPCTGSELRTVEPALSAGVRAGFLLETEGHVHPDALVPALGRALLGMGVSLIEGTTAIGLVTDARRVRAVSTLEGPVEGSDVVLAMGAWTPSLAGRVGIRLPVLAGKGYSFSAAIVPMPRRPVYMVGARLASTPRGDRLRVAGSIEIGRIDPRIRRARVARMISAAREYLPGMDPTSVRDVWTGMRPMAPDGLPIVGLAPSFDNLYVNTGHSTLGMTLAPASGESLAEMILTAREPQVLEPFRVDRW